MRQRSRWLLGFSEYRYIDISIYFLCNLIVAIKIFKLKLRFWRVAEERHGHVHIEHGHHLHRVSLQF